MKKTKTILLGLILLAVVATPTYGFVAGWIQRKIMILNQLTQIGNQTAQIKLFTEKLTNVKEQLAHMREATLGEIGAWQETISELVSAPTDLVDDTMSWGAEFTGEARQVVDAARSMGQSGQSLREGWRGMLSQADTVSESDVADLYRDLPPEVAERALEAWRRNREEADKQLVLDHTVSDAAAALAKSLKEGQQSLEKLRSNANNTDTGLAQAQLAGISTQGEILTALAQLQAYQAAKESAESYAAEVRRRREEAEWVERERREAQSWQKFFSLTEANKERARESLVLKTYPLD